MGAWNKLYCRALWSGLRFPEGRVYEDVYPTCEVLDACESVCVIDQTLYVHRRRPRSITTTCTPGNYRDWSLAHPHFESFVESRVPEVFTEGHVMQLRQSRVVEMISNYIRISEELGKDEDGFCEGLRRKTIMAGEEVGVDGLDLRTRTACHMLCACPWLLKSIYPAYHSVRRFVRNVTGR